MSAASEQLRRVIGALASDRRRSVAYYGNAIEAPGSSAQPRRLISDFGFPTDSQFQYVVPSNAHVAINREPRERINQLVINPYGLTADRTRLVATTPTQRRVSPTRGAGTVGVALLPTDQEPYYLSAELDTSGYSELKTVELVRALIDPARGPAYHFVITRRGDVIVCAALDDEVHANPSVATTSVSVALEGALVIRAADHAARRYDRLVELPYAEIQLFSLRVLFAKLRRALPAMGSPGLSSVFPTLPGARAFNFTNGAWRNQDTPFDHTTSDVPDFLERSAAVPPFDLGSQVFAAPQAPVPRATRTAARTAIATMDTVGERSPALAAYAPLASLERSHDMEATPRARFFVQRINTAHRDADDNGAQSQQVEATSDTDNDPPAMTGTGPFVFDFATGFWQDETPKTY